MGRLGLAGPALPRVDGGGALARDGDALGIESVAVYSEADRHASYLDLADHKVCIGPAPSLNSYLDISKIIAAAEITDVEAIHPGYGFLSENPQFAEICQSCRIQFIGPTVDNIRQLGDKAMARELAMASEVPVVPGSPEIVEDEEEGLRISREIGFPVLIKAVAGGGGRGMRIAREESTFVAAYQAARTEAANAFKNSDVYIEKLIEKPRHVEIQILADSYGSVIHLGERDCSLQRRHQKLVEESPSPAVDEDLRARMGASAVNLAKASGYRGAGTVEFLLDREGIRREAPLVDVDNPRFPVYGGLKQTRAGSARHDAVAWGFARGADRRGGATHRRPLLGVRRRRRRDARPGAPALRAAARLGRRPARGARVAAGAAWRGGGGGAAGQGGQGAAPISSHPP